MLLSLICYSKRRDLLGRRSLRGKSGVLWWIFLCHLVSENESGNVGDDSSLGIGLVRAHARGLEPGRGGGRGRGSLWACVGVMTDGVLVLQRFHHENVGATARWILRLEG